MLVFAIVLIAGTLLALGDELLVSGDLLRREDGFNARDLLVADLHHLWTIGIADGLKFGLGVIEDGLELAQLRWGEVQARLHLLDVAMAEILGVADIGADGCGGVVAVGERADENAAPKKQNGQQGRGPLIPFSHERLLNLSVGPSRRDWG